MYIRKKLFYLIVGILYINALYSQNVVHISHLDEALFTPTRLALDDQDNIFVTDPLQNAIVKYASDGTYLTTIPLTAKPLSIAIDQSNQIFVGNEIGGDIVRIQSDGSSSVFYSGSVMPSSMIFGTDGMLYIVDSRMRHIKVINVSGILINSFGADTFVFPTSIAFDAANERLLIGEHGGVGDDYQNCGGMLGSYGPVSKVYSYDLQGNLLGSFGCHGSANGKFDRVQGLAVGKCGNIYLGEPYQGNINVFSPSFSFVKRFGEFGRDPGQLNVPIDLKFDSQQRLIIASMNNGSLDIFSIEDSLPTSNIVNSDAIVCPGETTDIEINFTGTSPWTFTCGNNTELIDTITTSNSQYILTVSESGIYEVYTLSDQNYAGSCLSGSATVEVISDLASSIISSESFGICAGETVELAVNLTGKSPWILTYAGNGTDSVTTTIASTPFFIFVSEPGIYEVVSLTDAGGCPAAAMTGSSEVIEYIVPTVTMTSVNDTICSGEVASIPLLFSGTAPWEITYTLDDTIYGGTVYNVYTNPSVLEVTNDGIYQISAISDAHCEGYSFAQTSNIFVRNAPIAEYNLVQDGLLVTFTNTSTNGELFFWDFGDGTFSSEFSPVHTYQTTGVFQVLLTVTDAICGNSNFTQIVDLLTLIEDREFNEYFTLFPNPSDGKVTIEFDNIVQSEISIEIGSVSGQIVYSARISRNTHSMQLDLTELSQGIYTVRLYSEGFVKTGKLILLR